MWKKYLISTELVFKIPEVERYTILARGSEKPRYDKYFYAYN